MQRAVDVGERRGDDSIRFGAAARSMRGRGSGRRRSSRGTVKYAHALAAVSRSARRSVIVAGSCGGGASLRNRGTTGRDDRAVARRSGS